MTTTEIRADWCVAGESLVLCGTHMKEVARDSIGVKWCFRCRKRADFARVVEVPDGISYYGPNVYVECGKCGAIDGDLFPGRSREWDEGMA